MKIFDSRYWMNYFQFETAAEFLPYATYGLALIVTFCSQLVLSRTLTLANFGIFSSLYGQLAIVSGLATLGLEIAALRFATLYHHEGNSYLFNSFLKFGLAAIVASCAMLWLMTGLASRFWQLDSPVFGWIGLAIITTWSLTKFLGSMLRTVGLFNLSIASDRIVRDGILGVTVLGAAVLFHYHASVEFAEFSLLGGSSLAFLILTFAINSHRPHEIVSAPRQSPPHLPWFTASLGMWLSNCLELAFSRIEIILLIYFGMNELGGIFAIMLTISNLTLLPILALNIVFQPNFARLSRGNDQAALRAEIRKVIRVSLPPMFIIGVLIFFFPGEFLKLFGVYNSTPEVKFGLAAIVLARIALFRTNTSASLLLVNGSQSKLALIYSVSLVLKIIALLFAIAANSIIAVVAVTIVASALSQIAIYLAAQRSIERNVAFQA